MHNIGYSASHELVSFYVLSALVVALDCISGFTAILCVVFWFRALGLKTFLSIFQRKLVMSVEMERHKPYNHSLLYIMISSNLRLLSSHLLLTAQMLLILKKWNYIRL